MKKIIIISGLLLSLINYPKAIAQTTLFDIGTIQKMELFFKSSKWDYQLDSLKYSSDKYLMADSVKINGELFDSVGIKYKGNSSYDSTYKKNPIRINLNKYKTQNYEGVTDIKLANIYADPSFIREVLSYSILSNYMDCPKANFTQVYINGVLIGLFTNDETIDDRFCAEHFYSSSNTLIKGNPENPGPISRSNLKFINSDSSSYFTIYEIQSKYGWKDLVGLCDALTNGNNDLNQEVDVDRAVWMLAFNNVLVNLDSYSGAFAQNHYWYKNDNDRFNAIVWDLNMSLGGFPFTGSQGGGMGTLTLAGMQTMPLLLHQTDGDWPLIKKLFLNPTYKRMYLAHLRTICKEFFVNGGYATLATQLQSTIDTAVQSDPNKFYTYTQFQNGMTANVNAGSFVIPGISTLMNNRIAYLQSDSNYNYVAPVLSPIQVSSTDSLYQSILTVKVKAAGALSNSVYLAYRYYPTEAFKHQLLLDDGQHDDGVAGDTVYGGGVSILSGSMEYYFYAENNLAGIFSPQRAEHEFYIFKAKTSLPQLNEIVINEFLSNNNNLEKDNYNEREDWIELYNNSTAIKDLSGLYISDNHQQLLKWKIPNNTTLAPGSFLIIWADNDSIQLGQHTNFHLNKDSGVVLLSLATGIVLDSVNYRQQLGDISYGRYPNGVGSFIKMNPTFAQLNTNYELGYEAIKEASFLIYPNPAKDFVIIKGKSTTSNPLTIRNALGQLIYKENWNGYQQLSTSNWANGIYYISIGSSTKKLVIIN
jgi:hypothetical protein